MDNGVCGGLSGWVYVTVTLVVSLSSLLYLSIYLSMKKGHIGTPFFRYTPIRSSLENQKPFLRFSLMYYFSHSVGVPSIGGGGFYGGGTPARRPSDFTCCQGAQVYGGFHLLLAGTGGAAGPLAAFHPLRVDRLCLHVPEG